MVENLSGSNGGDDITGESNCGEFIWGRMMETISLGNRMV